LLIFLVLLLPSCANERVIPQPVIVKIPGETKWIQIPANLLVKHQKTTLPETLNYGDGLKLWAVDRATIDTLLGQLEGIETLNDKEVINGDIN